MTNETVKPAERLIPALSNAYTDRPLVEILTTVINTVLLHADDIREWIARNKLTPLQEGAIHLIPQATHLAASIQHLLDGALLLGSNVLLRPLIERVATMSYLYAHPNRVMDWSRDWKGTQRPNFSVMVSTIADGLHEIGSGDSRGLLHGLVHGNFSSEWSNQVKRADGGNANATHQMPNSPEIADFIALDTSVSLLAILDLMFKIFPSATSAQVAAERLDVCVHKLLPAAVAIYSAK